jgi:hypothetical protein
MDSIKISKSFNALNFPVISGISLSVAAPMNVKVLWHCPQGDQKIGKTFAQFLKSSQNSSQANNAKIKTIFKKSYLGKNVINL